MTNRRNTIQKDLVRNAVYKMKRHVTATEVYEFIKRSISYNRKRRQLDKRRMVRRYGVAESVDMNM